VISRAHRRFWDCFNKLPAKVQTVAREKYRLWQGDPFHPPLQFKPLLADVWSVRIGQNYRALARRHDDMAVWFWIGTHEEYNKLIKRLD
jgi:hypothetical protein